MRGLVKASLLFAPVLASAFDPEDPNRSDIRVEEDFPEIHVSTAKDLFSGNAM